MIAIVVVAVVVVAIDTWCRFRLLFVLSVVGHCRRKLKRSALYRAVIGVVIVAIAIVAIVIAIALHVIDCPPNLVNRPIGDYQVAINRIGWKCNM